MVVELPSFFQSLSAEDLERMQAMLPRRQFAAGATLLAEGERPTEMYVITAGVCAVFVRDRDGLDSRIGQIGPGATIGEMALFAGQLEAATVAPATLRALTALDVVTLDAPAFYALATSFPQVLHNIGAILSQRLTRSYQHALRAEHGRVTVLLDHGAPPVLAYALAASVAWHSRAPTLLVAVGYTGSADLEALAMRHGTEGSGGARLLLAPFTDEFEEAALAGTLEELSHVYAHVLLLVPWLAGAGIATRRTVHLADPSRSLPADTTGRPGHTVRGWTAPGKPWRPDAEGTVSVPALAPDDEQSLVRGLLATSSAAGKALGWLARDLCGLKVGLALGAGSVRGYAHYGVLRVFERIGLVADYVTGTSIGAIVASTYALGQSADEAARTMESTSMRAFRLTVPVHSLLSNAGISANFRQVSGDKRIEDLDVPLALVAADLTTGREVILRRGLLRLAALASMAIPGIYPPLRMGRHVLVDGGIVNPVPISVATGMGADVVIAVNLGRSARDPLTDVEATDEKQARLPSLLQAITRAVEVMQGRIGVESTAAATVLIEPDFAAGTGLGLQSFNKGRPYIAPGEAAALAAVPRIATCLPWLQG
jgi:NTE family protein